MEEMSSRLIAGLHIRSQLSFVAATGIKWIALLLRQPAVASPKAVLFASQSLGV